MSVAARPASSEPIDVSSPDPRAIEGLFSSIAPRYDLLNTLLSFGIDRTWRARTVRLTMAHALAGRQPVRLLDLGTGTGKLLGAFLHTGRIETAVGLDLCEAMLARASQAVAGAQWVHGNSLTLPFRDGCFDVVSSAFALRSLPDIALFFRECFRVLAPGGWLALLELTRPRSRWMRMAYFPYLKIYLPLLGRVVSRHPHAYRFLSESILAFQSPDALAGELGQAGFEALERHPLTGGAATLLLARRGSS